MQGLGNFKKICFSKSNKSFLHNISILFFYIKESGQLVFVKSGIWIQSPRNPKSLQSCHNKNRCTSWNPESKTVSDSSIMRPLIRVFVHSLHGTKPIVSGSGNFGLNSILSKLFCLECWDAVSSGPS